MSTKTATTREPKKGKGSDKPDAQTARQSAERTVLFKEVKPWNFSGDSGNGPITVDLAKEWLGWEDEQDYEKVVKSGKPKLEVLFTDRRGMAIRCRHNVTNRPLYMDLVKNVVQTLLNKQWAGPSGAGETVNGENIIRGRTGLLLDGQHRLIGLVLAEQERIGEVVGISHSDHWQKLWPGPVVMDSLVVTGIAESDKVVNTMNTGKPRSYADVVYRSGYLKQYRSTKDRTDVAHILDWSIRLLWERTWARKEAWEPSRTHAEGLDFLDRHETHLLKAVRHIWELDRSIQKTAKHEEQEGGRVSRFLKAAYAPAVLFMMGSSSSVAGHPTSPDANDYRDKEGVASEKRLKWDRWDVAAQFWTDLAQSTGKSGDPLAALWKLYRPEYDGATGSPFFSVGEVHGVGTIKERLALLALAWRQYVNGNRITDKTFAGVADLYHWSGGETLSGKWQLNSALVPTFGGIDLGPQVGKVKVATSGEGDKGKGKKNSKPPTVPGGDGTVKREPGEVKPAAKFDKDGLPPLPPMRKGKDKGEKVVPPLHEPEPEVMSSFPGQGAGELSSSDMEEVTLPDPTEDELDQMEREEGGTEPFSPEATAAAWDLLEQASAGTVQDAKKE